MNKNRITLALVTLAIVASGCTTANPNNNVDKNADQLAKDSGIDTEGVQPGTSFLTEMKATESNQQTLVQKQPIPDMENSLERENLVERLRTLNDRDKVFHVYLMSHGKVVSYFTAQGKVSSVNSKLTQSQQLVKCDRGSDGEWEELFNKDDQCVVDSPQLDGSYGSNGDGVFFFTTDGSYVEWNGEYVVSERPLNIQTPLSLEAEVEVDQ